MTTFSDDWSATFEVTPADNEKISLGAKRIRDLKVAISERAEVDHSWAGDANDGAHKKLTMLPLAGDPVAVAGVGYFYTKDEGSGVIELFYEDADGRISQITKYGNQGVRHNVFNYMTAAQITSVLARDFTVNVIGAINAAINAVAALGGGVIELPSGGYSINSTIILKSKVYLLGAGSKATEIKLANNSNCAMLEIENFSTLTLSATEMIADGMPYAFGLDGIRFNGNRTNQTAGNGIQLYGKRYHIGFDLMIVNPKEIGFYSEGGASGGQDEPDDMPEGFIGKVMVYESGKEGFVYRGPHDAIIHKVSVSRSGRDGVYDGAVFDWRDGVFIGGAYITGQIHCYACNGRGIVLRCPMQANILVGESCWKEGVVLETSNSPNWIGSYFATINQIEAYHNDQADTGLYYNIDIHGSWNTINSVKISNNKQSLGSLHIDGTGNIVKAGQITGQNIVSNGTGLLVEGDYSKVSVTITNQNNVGDIGFKTNEINYCDLDIIMYNCNIGWSNAGNSFYNSFKVHGQSSAGTPFVQTGSFHPSTELDVKLLYAGVPYVSKWWGSGIITAGNTFVTVDHHGFMTPSAADLILTHYTDPGTNRFWVNTITPTTFNISTNAVMGSDFALAWKMDI